MRFLRCIALCSAAFALAGSASLARAQQPPKPPAAPAAPAPAPAAAPAPAPAAAAPVAAPAAPMPAELAPAPALAPPPATVPAPAPAPAPALFRPYAWIKPTIIVASDSLESFSQPNASAATAAGNPVLSALRGEAHTTFQVAQSRFGFWFNEKAPVRGQLEFDLIDFTKSSPTVAAVPRVRIAKVEWQLSDSLLLLAGQDWDLFQPINPHTFDIVSVAFQAGNTAFMRQQAKFLYNAGSVELGAAVGLAGINNAARANIPEYGRLPTLGLRAALSLGTGGRVGLSAIGTEWRFAPDQPNERKAFAGGLGVFGDVTPFEHFNLRFEAYGGRNLGNLGTLSLATGSAAEDLDEGGVFVSAKYNLSEAHAVYVLGGAAQVLNDGDVLPSYAYPATVTAGDMPATSLATLAGTGAGISENFLARLGYEYRYDKTIAFVLEGFAFQSKHELNQDFDSRFDDDRNALGGELGLMFTL